MGYQIIKVFVLKTQSDNQLRTILKHLLYFVRYYFADIGQMQARNTLRRLIHCRHFSSISAKMRSRLA